MPKPFKIEQTGDRQQNQIQANIAAATQTARSSPTGDGLKLSNIAFKANVAQAVNHGLGRAYLGFVVVRLQALLSTYPVEQTVTGQDTTKTITLLCNQDCTVDLWMF